MWERRPGASYEGRCVTISALQRPTLPLIRLWLVNNWLAALWLLAAVVINVAGAKSLPEGFRQAVDLTAIPEADRAEMRRALAA